MADREKVIGDLEDQIAWIRDNDFHKFPGWGHAVLAMRDAAELLKEQEQKCRECGEVTSKAIQELLTKLKAQEASLEKVADDYGLTVNGVAFALEQYQTIISEITHGMMSKLTYRACDVLQVAQERWCDTCELKEAQEPPKMDGET